MKYDALIILDMQSALIKRHPYNEAAVLRNISALSAVCREHEVPVIYIRHDGGKGDELEQGCPGWQICADLAPMPQEKVIDKRFNSAFRNTELRAHLDSLQARSVLLCGMQTEFCFDVTCKVAFEYGYQVTIPQDTVTTFDSAFASGRALTEYYEQQIWKQRYATICPVRQVCGEIAE